MLTIIELADKYGYLPYMIQRYLDLLGYDSTIKLLEANEKPLKPWIRTNTLKINPIELKVRLEEKEFNLIASEWIPYAYKIEKESMNIGSLHEYLQGYFFIQNVVSMLPPLILNPSSSDLVIDMCAAPGGKSTHLAQLMQNRGKLVLIERNRRRIPALELNTRRLGVYNSVILNFDAKNLIKLNIEADKILLDAPCTGEGLIREDPSRKRSKSLNDIQKMSKIQKSLLSAGLDCLKQGGYLMYSTCSVAPEENEFVIDAILNKRDDLRIIKLQTQYGVPGYSKILGKTLNSDLKMAQRFFPYEHDTIGFFICLLQKI